MDVSGGENLVQSIIVLFGMLGLVFLAILKSGWVLTKKLGYTMFVLYLIFVTQDMLTAYNVWR